jgi:hypothetical protein
MSNCGYSGGCGGVRRLPKQVLAACPGLLLSAGALLAACSYDSRDAADAHSVVFAILTQDTLSAIALEPGTSVARSGWAPILAVRSHLPAPATNNVTLVKWENVRDRYGKARVFTYEVAGAEESAWVEVWIVSRGEETFLNTVRTYSTRPSP